MSPLPRSWNRLASFKTVVLAALALALAALLPAAASADGPAWELRLSSNPTNFPNGGNFFVFPKYEITAVNVGSVASSGPITITDTLPSGLTPASSFGSDRAGNPVSCEIVAQTVTCTDPGSVRPGQLIQVAIIVDVAAPEDSSIANQALISGGGAAAVQASTNTTISSTPSLFDFVSGASGLNAALYTPDGSPATQAGSHPYQLSVNVGFPASVPRPIENFEEIFDNPPIDGGVRDARTFLPRGLIVNPTATPVLCTEAELESTGICPDDSTVGTFQTTLGFSGQSLDPLYNMVPPAGVAASFATNVVGTGVFAHLLGGVRAGDYALSATSNDILSLYGLPVFGGKAQLWGDPSSPSHDYVRSKCLFTEALDTCSVDPQDKPLLTMPSACQESLTIEAEADSWGHQGIFHQRSALFTGSEGNPTGVFGCDNPELDFKPTLKARPTTNAADSPSGLDVDLHIPQREELSTLATPHLRKAEVTLPEGLVINPSSANGLAGCSSAQIGVDPGTGMANGAKPNCPNASRIGTVEVDTQLLDHPLPGSVFIATPRDNPFDALLAIYVVVDDPTSGVLIKLSGHVIPDPNTGRLTTVFEDNPQLPFEDFKLSFFGGAAAPLRTPPTCATYSTTSQMTPWSAPASGPPATPSDTYAISKPPAGGSCAGALPNSPSFDAGSLSLIAGRYTPFVLNLRRDDGTQQFSTITMTPPPGLLGKLAGTPYCPEAALAAAANKSGRQEQASPSCPAASQVGVVDVGAGAGPAPYYTTGKAYLAGPYKGAPLSLAIITPATAGPYDLGTVVVRTALNVDPETTRITAVSDPIPQILQGIPLDVRSIAVKLDKPDFTLNPTSCDPFTITGQLVSTTGQAAVLQNPFQVAECARLGFKPQLSLRLKGGTKRSDHPALKATLTYPKGNYANIAKASVALPHSEFLDQAHIGTVCTRVQFAAAACPKASVYGFAKAITPLLDKPLEGPVYLRSSDNPLPDLVADLNGQIHVVLDGRIDSVNGGIRSSFESVPDAPVSKFTLEMAGGKKGLLVNSRNLCKSVNKVTALFDGQNGKTYDSKPVLRNDCRAKAKKHKKHAKHRG